MTLISGYTCGKCKILEKKLKESNVDYEKIWAEENMDLCRQYNILELPTLLHENKIYIGLKACLEYIN